MRVRCRHAGEGGGRKQWGPKGIGGGHSCGGFEVSVCHGEVPHMGGFFQICGRWEMGQEKFCPDSREGGNGRREVSSRFAGGGRWERRGERAMGDGKWEREREMGGTRLLY